MIGERPFLGFIILHSFCESTNYLKHILPFCLIFLPSNANVTALARWGIFIIGVCIQYLGVSPPERIKSSQSKKDT